MSSAQPMVILGEPYFTPKQDLDELTIPVGQYDLALAVVAETHDSEVVASQLLLEYLSIVTALKDMGQDFRIVYAHPADLDREVIGILISLGVRFVEFPSVDPRLTLYPRDLGLNLPRVSLLNPRFGTMTKTRNHGYRLIRSPYGEGGRILHQDQTVLVAEWICTDSGKLPPADNELRHLGFRVGYLPASLSVWLKLGDKLATYSSNDHLDRIGCLLKGKDGGHHLVIDPGYVGGTATNPIPTQEVIRILQERCEPLQITLHLPKRMLVPYSVGCLQFPNGKVLMTGGDEAVAETIAGIVGEGNVTQTLTPIRYYPTWRGAGIHCLISEIPRVMMKD